jgi:hypothetical protein
MVRAQRSSDLLTKLSMTISWFWLALLVAPYVPFFDRLPGMQGAGRMATGRAFGLSVRLVLLVLVPLVLGLLHTAADSFQRRRGHFPRRYGELREAVDLLILGTGTLRDGVGVLLLSLGRGALSMFRWLLNLLLAKASWLLDVLAEWSSGERLDSFLVRGRPQDAERLAAFLRAGLEESGQRVLICRTTAAGRGASGALLQALDKALGVQAFVATPQVSVIVGSEGVAGTGELVWLGRFYLRVRRQLPLHLVQCSHPDAVGPEERLNAGQAMVPGTMEGLVADENVTMEDVQVLASKRALVEGRPYLPGG